MVLSLSQSDRLSNLIGQLKRDRFHTLLKKGNHAAEITVSNPLFSIPVMELP